MIDYGFLKSFELLFCPKPNLGTGFPCFFYCLPRLLIFSSSYSTEILASRSSEESRAFDLFKSLRKYTFL